MSIGTRIAAPKRIGLPFVLLALGQCSNPSGHLNPESERETIIRAALAAESAEWPSPSPKPCVQPGLRQPGDVHGVSGAVATVSQDWLPKPFSLCGTRANDSFLWLADPQVQGQEGFVEVDFHCGGMCGTGKTYSLKRSSVAWKVTGASVTWRS